MSGAAHSHRAKPDMIRSCHRRYKWPGTAIFIFFCIFTIIALSNGGWDHGLTLSLSRGLLLLLLLLLLLQLRSRPLPRWGRGSQYQLRTTLAF